MRHVKKIWVLYKGVIYILVNFRNGNLKATKNKPKANKENKFNFNVIPYDKKQGELTLSGRRIGSMPQAN